jgi:4'-phosphopantetheinyl transferase
MDDTTVELHPRGADDHALLAALAGRLLGRPAVVEHLCPNCGATDHGRPLVEGAFVSLSRAGGLVALAVSLDGAVGIDIETVAGVAASGFDDVAFSAPERDEIARAGDPDLHRARLWTAKEAVLKARGTGLRTDPRLVDVRDAGVELETSAPEPGYVVTVARLREATPSRSTAR